MKQDLRLQVEEQGDRCEYNKKTLNRIRRIRGQLNALERLIESDDGTCEDRVLRARTIEKGMTSLINHLVDCYIENTVQHEMQTDPEATVQELQKILKLMNN